MEIEIKRDSVSMEDVCDHTVKLEVTSSTTYEEVIRQLAASGYFPDMPGKHPVWVLTHPRHSSIASLYSQDNIVCPGLTTRQITAYGDAFRFKYYASPELWKIAIYDFYDGSGYAVWHEGWSKELQIIGDLMK